MFRKMRRGLQELGKEECDNILKNGDYGVLALDGDDGYPYALPINYCYDGDKIYFHCALTGHKIDAVKRNPKASFCVVAQSKIVAAEYTDYFKSVIAFGTIRIIESDEEKRAAIKKLARKYAPNDSADNMNKAIDDFYSALCMLEFTPCHITGKQAKELIKK